MIRLKLVSIFFSIILFCSAPIIAQTYTWTNAGGTGLWSDPNNWNSISPGSIPNAASPVVINSSTCTMDMNVSVGSINIGGGTLTQTSGYTIRTAADFSITSGTFNGGNSNIRVVGSFSQTGGTFNSTSAELQVRGNAFSYTGGTFSASGGTVRLQPGFESTTTMSVTGNPGLNNLRFDGGSGGVLTLNNSLDVNGLTIAGVPGANSTLNLGGNNLNVNGDMSFGTSSVTSGNISINNGNINLMGTASDLFIYNTGTGISTGADGGSATINFTGSGVSEINSSVSAGKGILPNINISKPSGSLNMTGTISLSGNWTQTSGTVAPLTSTVDFINLNFGALQNVTVSSMSFHNMIVDATNTGTLNLGSNLDLNGNLTINDGASLNTSVSNFNLTVGGNWMESSAGTFVPNASIVTFDGTSPQTLYAHTGFSNVLVNTSGSGSVTLNSNISITNNLTLTNGVLYTNTTSVLNIADNAFVSGGSNLSYVDGPIMKTGDDPFTFPVGSGGYFHPISISAPISATDVFTAQYFYSSQTFGGTVDATIKSLSNCEYWNLDRTGGSSSVYVSIGWISAQCTDYAISDVNDLVVSGWDGTKWQNFLNGGTTGNTSAGTVQTLSPISVFGPFTLGSTTISSPLPIELLSFDLRNQNNAVEIYWTTASEVNNDFFTVQRSSTAKEFLDIENIPSKNGDTKSLQKYSYIDKLPLRGHSYYRLKQTDIDGHVTYSKVKEIQIKIPKDFLIFPNPYSGKQPLSIALPQQTDGNIYLSLTDSNGKTLYNYSKVINNLSYTTFSLTSDIDQIDNGVYYLILHINGHKYTEKLIVIK